MITQVMILLPEGYRRDCTFDKGCKVCLLLTWRTLNGTKHWKNKKEMKTKDPRLEIEDDEKMKINLNLHFAQVN